MPKPSIIKGRYHGCEVTQTIDHDAGGKESFEVRPIAVDPDTQAEVFGDPLPLRHRMNEVTGAVSPLTLSDAILAARSHANQSVDSPEVAATGEHDTE